MLLIHVRITHLISQDEERAKYLSILKQHCLRYFVVEEHDASKHIHVIYECNYNSVKTARTHFLEWFPQLKEKGNGNKKYGGFKKAEDRWFAYVCKGPDKVVKTYPIVLANTIATDDEVQASHELYWSQRPIKVNMVQLAADGPVDHQLRVKKKTVQTFMMKTIEQYKLDNPLDEVEYTDYYVEKLTRYLLRKMGPLGKALDEMILWRNINALFNGVMAEDSRESFDSYMVIKMKEKRKFGLL